MAEQPEWNGKPERAGPASFASSPLVQPIHPPLNSARSGYSRDLCGRSAELAASSRNSRSSRRTRRRAMATVTPSHFAIARYVSPCERSS
jgi:hypothetical protein